MLVMMFVLCFENSPGFIHNDKKIKFTMGYFDTAFNFGEVLRRYNFSLVFND